MEEQNCKINIREKKQEEEECICKRKGGLK